MAEFGWAYVGDGNGITDVPGPSGSVLLKWDQQRVTGSSALIFNTGSNVLEVYGDISASANISASYFYGDGSNLTNLPHIEQDLDSVLTAGNTSALSMSVNSITSSTANFTGLLAGTAVNTSSYLALDSNNNIILTSSIGGGGGSITVKDEGSTLTTTATSLDFVGAGVTATNSGGDVTITINGGASGFSRTAVTSTITASVSDRILGVSASAPLEIRLPDASTYSNGQFFIVKDEAGNAGTNTITILTSNSQTIDGELSIVLESPYSAINIYCDGTSKFFIY